MRTTTRAAHSPGEAPTAKLFQRCLDAITWDRLIDFLVPVQTILLSKSQVFFYESFRCEMFRIGLMYQHHTVEPQDSG